ncbi:Elongation of very long chain fatty acids protein AAEL008004 [Gryllus bimaculatus]|nr:Elongation of very long chain fatty acids protein AAEL008004 [Gryllus bimaculatus]
MRRPFTVLGLVAAYALFVTRLGPWMMRDRKPFKLKRTLIVYNALQIIANAYVFYMVGSQFWFSTYSWRCEPIDTSNSPSALEMIRLIYIYFWLKIADLFDTIFFVLRKKNQQISFLHLYHHSNMVILVWAGLKYFPGGHGTFLGLLNTFVHVCMYTYYLIAAVYPHNIWWKKYVTQLQLVQHTMVGLHLAQLFVSNPCNFPMLGPQLLVPQCIFLVLLFSHFYQRTYGRKAAQDTKAKAS